MARASDVRAALETAINGLSLDGQAGKRDTWRHAETRGGRQVRGADRLYTIELATQPDRLGYMNTTTYSVGYLLSVLYAAQPDIEDRIGQDTERLHNTLDQLHTVDADINMASVTPLGVDIDEGQVTAEWAVDVVYNMEIVDPQTLDLTKSWLGASDTAEYWSCAAAATALSDGMPFTLAFRFKPGASASGRYVLSLGYGSSFRGFFIAATTHAVQTQNTSGGMTGATTLTDDTWNSAMITSGTAAATVNVNGVEDATRTAAIIDATFDRFTVGLKLDDDTTGVPWAGHLFEIAVWLNDTKSEADSLTYHNSNAAIDARALGLGHPDYYWILGMASGSPLTVQNLGSAGTADLVATAAITSSDIVTEAP